MNFVPDNAVKEMSDFLKEYGIDDVYFAKYAPDPFEDEDNHEVYNQILSCVMDVKNGVMQTQNRGKKRLFGR